jgi:hypothetical protein
MRRGSLETTKIRQRRQSRALTRNTQYGTQRGLGNSFASRISLFSPSSDATIPFDVDARGVIKRRKDSQSSSQASRKGSGFWAELNMSYGNKQEQEDHRERITAANEGENFYTYSFRENFRNVFHSSGAAFWFDFFQLVLSIVAILMYLYETYMGTTYSAVAGSPKNSTELGTLQRNNESCNLQLLPPPLDYKCVGNSLLGCSEGLGFESMDRFCRLDVALTMFFALDYLIHVFLSEYFYGLPRYVFSFMGVVDLMTILPIVLLAAKINAGGQLYIVRVIRVLRALRVLKIYRLLHFSDEEVGYHVAVLMFTTVAVVFIATGMFQALDNAPDSETGIGPWIEYSPATGKCHDMLKFHDALYFILVTLSTIGYGDYSPRTDSGKVIVILLGLAIILIVPGQVHELTLVLATRKRLMSKTETYAQLRKKAALRSMSPMSSQTGHVIVAGHISPNGVCRFLMEFLHPCRGHVDFHVVIICEESVSDLIHIKSLNRKYNDRIFMLTGDLLTDKDLKRADMLNAEAVFLFTGHKHLNTHVVDSQTILQCLSIRSFCAREDAKGRALRTQQNATGTDNPSPQKPAGLIKSKSASAAALRREQSPSTDGIRGRTLSSHSSRGVMQKKLSNGAGQQGMDEMVQGTEHAVEEGPSLHIQLGAEHEYDEQRALQEVTRYEQVVHTTSLKSAILARNCVYPGTVTLLFNLVRSFDQYDMKRMGHDMEDENTKSRYGYGYSPEAEPLHQQQGRPREGSDGERLEHAWRDEYLSGLCFQLHNVTLDPDYDGMEFTEAAIFVYR